MNERIRLFARNSGNRRQQFDGFSNFFFKTFGDNDFGVNVHFPAGELGRQPRVLSALADGE